MISRCLPHPNYPSVSIGLPVFNGAAYLRQALDSLVTQDYPNFEIHVSDNASTDETWKIINEYAQKCDRFRLHRWSHNRGAVKNFQHVLIDCDATYFTWAAFDDVWSSDFISKAVSILEADATAVMASPMTTLIDASGNLLPKHPTRPSPVDLGGMSYPERIGELAHRVGWCIYGLIRRDALLSTSVFGQQELTHDVILTYELASMGTFRLIEDCPFFYRVLPKQSTHVAEQLGLKTESVQAVFTKLFLKCAKAVAFPFTPHLEATKALEIFLNVCAGHEEWWPLLCAENNWDSSISEPLRVEKLRSLSLGI